MNMNLRKKFSRGAPLIPPKQRRYFLRDCWRLLLQDKKLFLSWMSATLFSSLACVAFALAAVFAFILSSPRFNITNEHAQRFISSLQTLHQHIAWEAVTYISVFSVLAFLSLYIVYFLNGALAYVFTQRLEGKDCRLSQGMRRAWDCKWKVFQWFMLSLFIHRIVALLERQHRILAAIFAIVVACGWSLAGFFVMPIMLEKKIGPIAAFKISGQCFRKNFRRTLSFGIMLSLMTLGLYAAWFFELIHFNMLLSIMPFYMFIILQITLLATLVLWAMAIKALRLIAACALYLKHVQGNDVPAMPSIG